MEETKKEKSRADDLLDRLLDSVGLLQTIKKRNTSENAEIDALMKKILDTLEEKKEPSGGSADKDSKKDTEKKEKDAEKAKGFDPDKLFELIKEVVDGRGVKQEDLSIDANIDIDIPEGLYDGEVKEVAVRPGVMGGKGAGAPSEKVEKTTNPGEAKTETPKGVWCAVCKEVHEKAH